MQNEPDRPLPVRSSDGLGMAGAVAGSFGSLYQNILVLRVPDGPWYYVLVVNDDSLRWGLYCNDASIMPAHSGEITDVECLGQRFLFPCWRVNRGNYVRESMTIAALPQVARSNVELTCAPGLPGASGSAPG